MTISLMNVMEKMMSKLLTLPEVLKEFNNYLDSNPPFENHSNGNISAFLKNSSIFKGYDDIVEVFGCDRYMRIKLRNPEILVEYQLDMMPWSNGFNFKCWHDGSDSECPWTPKTNPNRSSFYIETEEEYFQLSTVKNLKDLTLETITSVKKLQDRLFEYYNIVPDTTIYGDSNGK